MQNLGEPGFFDVAPREMAQVDEIPETKEVRHRWEER